MLKHKKIILMLIFIILVVSVFKIAECCSSDLVEIEQQVVQDTPNKIISSTCLTPLDYEYSFLNRFERSFETNYQKVEVEEPLREPEEAYYFISEDEYHMLASLVYLESGACSLDCQKAVASVIFNRLESGAWNEDINGDNEITLYDIVYYPAAFSPAHRISKTKTSSSSYEAVEYVLLYGPTVPQYVRYFRSDYDFKWINYKHYTKFDNMYFGYFEHWEEGAW